MSLYITHISGANFTTTTVTSRYCIIVSQCRLDADYFVSFAAELQQILKQYQEKLTLLESEKYDLEYTSSKKDYMVETRANEPHDITLTNVHCADWRLATESDASSGQIVSCESRSLYNVILTNVHCSQKPNLKKVSKSQQQMQKIMMFTAKVSQSK